MRRTPRRRPRARLTPRDGLAFLGGAPRHPGPARRDPPRPMRALKAPWAFRQQCSQAILSPPREWDPLVLSAIRNAKEIIGHEDLVVHVNWYPDGTAGVSPHKDDEPYFVPGAPIVSYTFLSNPELPRAFQIIGSDKRTLEHNILLGHGDRLVMGGKMQQEFFHGVKPTSAKQYVDLRRINLTVRAIDAEYSRKRKR